MFKIAEHKEVHDALSMGTLEVIHIDTSHDESRVTDITYGNNIGRNA